MNQEQLTNQIASMLKDKFNDVIEIKKTKNITSFYCNKKIIAKIKDIELDHSISTGIIPVQIKELI